MLILVTGGAGFIGSHIVTALHTAGHRVRVLDALLPAAHGPDPAPPALPGGVEWQQADVRDRAAVDEALRGVDAVCHQAAMVGLGKDFADAPDYASHNVHGTAVLLAAMAAAGVRSLVLAGSMVVYGEGRYECRRHGAVRPGPRLAADLDAGRFEPPCPHCGDPLAPGLVDEDAPADPRNVYATTKLAQEHLAAAWARDTGGQAVALRYHNVYGPGMPRDTPYAGVAALFRSALARGQAPAVYEDGGQRRDFIHVTDVAAANAAALTGLPGLPGLAPGTLRHYNVATGAPHTIAELATLLATACGGPAPRITGSYRLGDVRHITASAARIRTDLSWTPRVPFHAGIPLFAHAPLRRG
jgi:dTDP-L-rhamnose 4-epimerase